MQLKVRLAKGYNVSSVFVFFLNKTTPFSGKKVAPEKLFYQLNFFPFNTSTVPPQLSSQPQEQIDVTYLHCFMIRRYYFLLDYSKGIFNHY